MPSDIKGLHHTAYRCNDLEETRKFYEDFLGLPLVRPPLGAQVPLACSPPAAVQAAHVHHTLAACASLAPAPSLCARWMRWRSPPR